MAKRKRTKGQMLKFILWYSQVFMYLILFPFAFYIYQETYISICCYGPSLFQLFRRVLFV